MVNMGALEGITVLDLSRILAGPYCTQILSDLGATVWKIEPPWGDETRRFGPPFISGESTYYLSANRGKKSLAINLKDPRGQDIARRLTLEADIFVENFKTGDLSRYGLDYKTVSRINPKIIYASITGFGHIGPRTNEPAVDLAIQGMSGIMSATGEPDQPPTKVGVAWVDILSGQTAAIGILAALQERERSGKGQSLDISLFDVGLASMANLGQSYLITKSIPEKLGNAHPNIAPYQVFDARDGPFILSAVNDEFFRKTTVAIGHPEIWNDKRFQTNSGRVKHRKELVPLLAEVFRLRDRSDWIKKLGDVGVPTTPVLNISEALEDPQSKARNAVWEIQHPVAGKIPLLASPLQHMGRTPASPQGHPPLLGEHTREILAEILHFSKADLKTLEDDGVITHTDN